ncbi:hypothetical protein TD95_004631 [Thielaviopsis punctulata]|uniref:Structural maintenance of chromosomes protein 5 n=1 Tax=Thielaviopsis punctulata TaxID=72032 RepID=A0A0F4ZJI7_9PEZI|nr:hypothetical protein TD95_004631 [Thielaviopsis punctulata]
MPRRSRIVGGDVNPVVESESPGSWSRDDYQVGAIMRVYLENFLTYDKAEFMPGPFLNMVIGPNGTGKSSLVNAICIGLGFSPRLLARGSTVGEFVKHNQNGAVIETELRGEGLRNICIRAKISRETNQIAWSLDGRSVTHKRVQEVVRALKIQVDNLCQFLPQDRVAEFARLNEVELLTETLRAAAPEDVSTTHRELLEQHKAKDELQKRLDATIAELESRRNLKANLQDEVDRINERETIKVAIEHLEAACVCAEYEQLTKKFVTAKRNRDEARKNLKRLETQSDPSLKIQENKEIYMARLEEASSRARKQVQAAEQALSAAKGDLTNAQQVVEGLREKLQQADAPYQSVKKQVASTKRRIADLQGELTLSVTELNIEEQNSQIRQGEHRNRDRLSQIDTIRSKIRELMAQAGRKDQQKNKLLEDLEALNTQKGQRLKLLKKVNEDAFNGFEWLEHNGNKFEMEVFGPALLTCSVKDERFSDQVEDLLTRADLTCFTTQCVADHKTLSEQFYKVMGLSVTIRTCATKLSSLKPPLSSESARQLGLDGFAVDLLEGPEPILAMLCVERRLHNAAIALRQIDDESFTQLESIPAITNIVVGNQGYRIARRREYGNASTTNVRQVRQAQFLANQNNDMSAETGNIERMIAEIDDDIMQIKRLSASEKEQYKKLIEENREDEALVREYQDAVTRRDALPIKLARAEQDLAREKRQLRDARHNLQDLEIQARLATIKLGPPALACAEAVAAHHAAIKKRMIHQVLVHESRSDVSRLQHRAKAARQKLKSEREKAESLARICEELRQQGKTLMRKVSVIKEKFDMEAHINPLYEGETLEEVTAKLAAEKTKLELLHVGNPETLRRYDNLTQQIGGLEKQLQNSSDRMAQFDQNIRSKQSIWEASVETLVSKISSAFAYNFEQIGCAGEVQLHKADKFEEWALHILVCFRVHEAGGKLVQLTGNRQSGGERSVSTVFFLMALQADAQSPFRVVDEINQGMDPRNERMVHNRMVEIACREHSCQYFLITPKLLTDLTYDDKMTVLCIASGPQMPADVMKLDFGALIRKQKTLVA